MSIRHANQPQFPLRGLREGPAAPWVRPADWPGLPWIPDADEAFVGLFAVHNSDNAKVALLCAGAYTVDWGDGTAPENVATGVKAEHQYIFATLATKVTSHGYKTATIKVYPQAGQNLTTINLQQRPTGFVALESCAAWLDIQINARFASSINLASGGIVVLSLAERVHIRAHAMVDMQYFFYKMSALRSVPWFNTTNNVNAFFMFRGCSSITEIPPLDFSNANSAGSGFYGCESLVYVPPLNLSKATNIDNLFVNCYSLSRIPTIIVKAGVSANGFAASCPSLIEVGEIAFTSTASIINAFDPCRSIARCKITGIGTTHSYANCNLPASSLNEIFSNLATVTGKTITVTGNPGAATCDTAIATAKGWTVVT